MAEDKISQRVSLFTNTLKTSYPQIYGGLTEQDFSAKIKSDPAFQKESYAALRALNKFSNLPESDSDYLKLFSSDVPAPQTTTAKPVETPQPAAEQPVSPQAPSAQPAPTVQQPQPGQITEAEFNDDGGKGPVGVLAANKGPDLNQSMRNLVTGTPKEKQEMASDAAKNAMDDERTFAQKWGIGGDVDMSMWEGFKQIVKNTLAGAENYLATGDRATIEALKKARQEIKEGKKPDLAKAYIDVNEERQQRLYKKAGEIQNDFQKRIGDLNIETSVYQQLKKGNFSRLPEATAYTVANSAMQIIPALFTYGGSSYLQTIPDSYKAGVDAIAQAKGVTPEEVIKSGDDAQLVAQISSVTQAALDYFGAGMISKSMATKGGYAAVRDWLIKKGMGKNFARTVGLTYAGGGEMLTETLQEGVAITGEIASPKNSIREFISKFPKEFWTPENRERIYDSAIAGFVGGLGADAGGSAIRKMTSPPESLGGIPTRPVSQPAQGQPIAPAPAPAPSSGPTPPPTSPPPTNQPAPAPQTEPVQPTGPVGQPLTDDEIENLSPGQKWKRFSGPDAGLSDIVGDLPIQVLHNGNGITYTAEKTGEEVDGVPIFNITSPDGKTTQVEGDIARFQVLPQNETENGTSSESENEPVTGTSDGVVRGNDVVPTTGNTGEFSPEQKSDIRNAVPFTAAGWARKYFLEGGQVNTQSASKEVTGLRNGKGSKDVINGIIGHHSNKPDAPSVERIAEILRTRANEEGIELDEQDLRDAVIQAIANGKKSWMADQAKEVLPQSQWEPEGFELDYYFPKQEFPETPVHKFPGLNDEESKKLTDFVRERIPGGISKDGVIALSKLQGIAEEAAMNEVLGPDLAAKVQGLPLDAVQEATAGETAAGVGEGVSEVVQQEVDTDESVVKKLTDEHGEPESPQTEKERKKIFANTLLDTDNEDAAFHKAGYTLKDGIWFHPKGDGIKAWDALNDETKAILKKNNVRFIEDMNDGIHAGGALLHQVGSGKDMRFIRGMALLYHGDHYVGGNHNHVAIHELGHSIWVELPQETKDLFNDGNPLSEHGKNVKKGEGKYGEAYGKAGGEDGWQVGEEDFADLFALNKGDLDKTIQDKKDQVDKSSKEVADLQTQKPIVAENAVNENMESGKPNPTFKNGPTLTFESTERKNGKVIVVPNTKPGTYDAMKMTVSDDGKFATFEIDPTQVRGFNDIISDFRKVFPFISVKGVPSGRMGDAETVNKGILRKDENGDWVVEKKADVIFYGRNYNQDEPMPTKKPLDFSFDKPKEPTAEVKKQIDEAAHQAATSPKNDLPEPTEDQKRAGNYQLGHVNIQGLDISIENPEGSERKGVDPDGNAWSVKMKNHYGYIRGTEGADGDHVDVFIGPNPESDKVFVIDQVNQDGTLDEHKSLVGFDSEEEARKAYLSNYSKGWTGLGAITEMSMDDFKEWLKTEDPKKPVGDISKAQKKEETEQKEPTTPEQETADQFQEIDRIIDLKGKEATEARNAFKQKHGESKFNSMLKITREFDRIVEKLGVKKVCP